MFFISSNVLKYQTKSWKLIKWVFVFGFRLRLQVFIYLFFNKSETIFEKLGGNECKIQKLIITKRTLVKHSDTNIPLQIHMIESLED